jgi:hypothetical protein
MLHGTSRPAAVPSLGWGVLLGLKSWWASRARSASYSSCDFLPAQELGLPGPVSAAAADGTSWVASAEVGPSDIMSPEFMVISGGKETGCLGETACLRLEVS